MHLPLSGVLRVPGRTLGAVAPVVIRNNRLAARQTIGFALLILLSAGITLAPLLAILSHASGAGRAVVLVLLVLATAWIGFLVYCVVRSWRQRAVIDERGILVANLVSTPFVPWSQLGGMYTDQRPSRTRKPIKAAVNPWHVAVLSRPDGTHVRVRVTYAHDKTQAYN